MTEHVCQAVVVHCTDARLQKPINDWLKCRFGLSDYDRISLPSRTGVPPVFAARTVAGSVFELETVLKQMEISNRRHKTRKVILVNYENCGAYGDESTPERHAADLRKAEQRIKAILPQLEVELYYLHLTGIFEKIPSSSV